MCTGSLCTFIQFIKDITLDGRVQSFVLRFEPGSKRMCLLETVTSKSEPTALPFETQISATDETSSVEATPRTPREEDTEEKTTDKSNGSLPRLRKMNRQDSTKPPMKRRNTLTQEMGASSDDLQAQFHEQLQKDLDNDNDKYGPKKRRHRKWDNEPDLNMTHISILFLFIGFAFVGLPWFIQWLGHAAPY